MGWAGQKELAAGNKRPPPAEQAPGPVPLPADYAEVAFVSFPSWSEGQKDCSPGPPGTLGVVTVVTCKKGEGEGKLARKPWSLVPPCNSPRGSASLCLFHRWVN